MKNFILFLFVIFFMNYSNAQSSIDLMCRSKAKETAAQIYRNCVTETKQVELKKLRDDYKKSMNAVKNDFEGKLKRIQGGAAAVESTPTILQAPVIAQPPVRTRASKEIARSLPEKRHAVEPQPVQAEDIQSEPAAEMNVNLRNNTSQKGAHPYGDEDEMVEMPISE